MAEGTDDDCLRAELLRAHWGLNRRLQCWSLMRDIAVASVAENRFAARVPWTGSSNALSGQGHQSRRFAFAQRRPRIVRAESNAPRGPRDLAATTAAGRVERCSPTRPGEPDRTELPQRQRAARALGRAAAAVRARAAFRDQPRPRSHRGHASPRPVDHQLRKQSESPAGRRALARQSGIGRNGRFRHVRRWRTGEGPHAGHDGVQRRRSRSSSSATASRWARARPTPTTPAGWSASTANSIGCRSSTTSSAAARSRNTTRSVRGPKLEVECKVADRVEEQLDDRAGDGRWTRCKRKCASR